MGGVALRDRELPKFYNVWVGGVYSSIGPPGLLWAYVRDGDRKGERKDDERNKCEQGAERTHRDFDLFWSVPFPMLFELFKSLARSSWERDLVYDLYSGGLDIDNLRKQSKDEFGELFFRF
ncbi:hypothetical protein ACFX2J_043863 [Malus domestica]